MVLFLRRNVAPIFLTLTVILTNVYLLREFTAKVGQSFLETVSAQYAAEFASGNSVEIGRRILLSTPALPWKCVRAQRDGHVFLSQGDADCGAGVLGSTLTLVIENGNKIELRMVVVPPRSWIILTELATVLEIAVLLLYTWHVGTIRHRAARRAASAEAALELARVREDRQSIELELARSAAIARTTQALAHDVRKPFTLVQSLAMTLEGEHDPLALREILQATLPEISAALTSVDGMVQDVMEIGSHGALIQEPVNPESLVEAVLGEAFRVLPESAVEFVYDFRHTHKVNVASLKVGRVFSNIVGNAVQAMGGHGRLWFHTREENSLVEFTIGNAGSFIPPAHLSQLFDAFFTSGKKGGTGLGLAIAKKVVEDHGGSIRCESEKNDAFPTGKVEFRFTLPASSEAVDARPIPLVSHSREIAEAAARLRGTARSTVESSAEEEALEQGLLGLLARREGSFEILMVDDEVLYHNTVASLLSRAPRLAERVRLRSAHSFSEALAAVKESNPLFVIQDLDLGKGRIDGIAATKALRLAGYAGQICIHSNRFLFEDGKVALDAGANVVLPKPLGRAHLLKLLRAALEAQPATAVAPAAPLPHTPADAPPAHESRPQSIEANEGPLLRIAIVDDNIGIRMGWKSSLSKKTNLHTFAGAKEFWDASEANADHLPSFDAIVTDFHFAKSDPDDGGTFALALRERGYAGLILLASGDSFLEESIAARFDANIGKSPLAYPRFLEIFQSTRVGREAQHLA